MQNSNLYFCSQPKKPDFWNKQLQTLPFEVRKGLQEDTSTEVQLMKVGKILKMNTRRWYKTYSHYLFYFDEVRLFSQKALVCRAYIDLQSTYFRFIVHPKPLDGGYTHTLIFTQDFRFQQLFGKDSEDLTQFILEMSRKCILLQFLDHYKIINQIGVGSTSEVRCSNIQVYMAERIIDGEKFAIKTLKKDLNVKHKESKVKGLLEEITNLRELEHPNIQVLHHVYESEQHIHLVLSLFNGKELIEKTPKASFADKKLLAYNLVSTLEYIHKHGIMHRDLKPQNIIYKNNDPNDLDFVIVDFGFATKIHQASHVFHKCGTPGYVAPEIIEYKDNADMYDETCDIFSLGVLLYQIFYEIHPFKGKNPNDTIRMNASAILQFDPKLCLPSSLERLITSMCQKLPQNRLSAQKCLQHEFFTSDIFDQGIKQDQWSSRLTNSIFMAEERRKSLHRRRATQGQQMQQKDDPVVEQQTPIKSMTIHRSTSIRKRQQSTWANNAPNAQTCATQNSTSVQNKEMKASLGLRNSIYDRESIYFDQHQVPENFGDIYLLKTKHNS